VVLVVPGSPHCQQCCLSSTLDPLSLLVYFLYFV
jgi:hypothetical protein